MAHLPVSQFHALRTYGIRPLGIGQMIQTKINKVSTYTFLFKRLAQQQGKHETQFCIVAFG